uniref:Sodium channel protein Nach n=1 Tax=Stomoxys calcitrans TaxID=35570 RepID=A0A1I8PF91_STOCA
MSKSKVRSLAERFRKKNNFTADHLVNLFRLVLYATATIEASPEEWLQLGEVLERNNMTLYQLENRLKPSCETTILRCKWKGRYERCSNIFEIIKTSQGNCCSFNKLVLKSNANKRTDFITNENVEYTTSCGPQTGLTVLLNPELEDYHLAARKTPGMKVFIQDAYDFTPKYALHSVITPKSVNYLSITPQQTRASDYIASLKLHVRRCYLPQERKLFHFPTYSQPNCLAECRSARMYEKCHCTLNYWPKKMNWTICGWHDRECVSKHKDVYSSILKSYNADYRQNYYAESFICDCYPLCDFNMYAISEDSGKLNRQYALTDQRFFKDINITNHMVLHVYYGTLYAERLRLDVYENWLTFIGNFGGITGLHMGYSFVSGFEMIFFVFVRPACNWLTKKQIRYRVQRRQKKAKLEADKKRKMEEEKEKQERIEAFLKMRPHCPQY